MTRFFVYFLLSLPLVGAYSMLAIGIVVVFRASRVLNLAQGAMAMLPAYAVYQAQRSGVPLALAVPIGVAVGALLGAVVERFFVRPLAKQGPTAQTVGTVAVYGVVVAAAAQIWGSGAKAAPRIFPDGGLRISGSLLTWGQIGLFFVALVCAGAFYALFQFTSLGLAMRGSADNPRAAGLMGIDADRMARIAWLLGGGLAGLAGILLAAITSLQPYTLSLQMLPGFVGALIGGLGSLPGALIGSAVVGVAQGMVPAFTLIPGMRKLASQVGMPQLVLTVIALAVMYLRGGRYSAADSQAALSTETHEAPTHSAYEPDKVAQPTRRRREIRALLLIVLVAWPFLGVPSFLHPLDTYSLLGDAILACEYFLAASSIVMLTGWVGQISLSQAAFVGVSAFGSALFTRHTNIGFPFSLLVGAGLSAGASALLGVVALRVRGLYLAVATLIFAWMADQYLFVVPWFTGTGGTSAAKTSPIGVHGGFPYFDFTERKTFYFVILAVAGAVLFGLLNLRDSKTGRAFAAVRGSEMAAASFGIDVIRYKLVAFAAAGFIAGIAGNLMLTHQVAVVPDQFALKASLLFLAIAVVGGLRSLNGAVVASMVFAGLSELFFRVPALGQYLQLVSASLLAFILLVYPGGLAALPADVRRWRRSFGLRALEPRYPFLTTVADPLRRARSAVLDGPRRAVEQVLERRRQRALEGKTGPDGAPSSVTGIVVPLRRFAAAGSAPVKAEAATANGNGNGHVDFADVAALAEPKANELVVPVRHIDLGQPVVIRSNAIVAKDITVQFGGLTAVEKASLRVGAGQIVGLIGPNGAGKTTLFNAISGLNTPTRGTVKLLGEDVTDLPVHERAARGLARTFQVIQVFPELTVFENLLVATHLHNPSSLVSNVFATVKAVTAEVAAEETCRQAVRFLGLEEIADRPVAGLPFGTLRMVEIARALATGAPVLMLDEPASGLDNNETDRLSELLLVIRKELGISILLIEHDVKMVTSVSDYMYVLNRGRMLAEGKPADIQRDPAVIAAYLGEAPAAAEDKPAAEAAPAAAASSDDEPAPARRPRKAAARS